MSCLLKPRSSSLRYKITQLHQKLITFLSQGTGFWALSVWAPSTNLSRSETRSLVNRDKLNFPTMRCLSNGPGGSIRLCIMSCYLADLSADLLKFNSLLITMRDSCNTHPAVWPGSSPPRGSELCTTSPAARGDTDSRTPASRGSCTAPVGRKILLKKYFKIGQKINVQSWQKKTSWQDLQI